MTATERAGQALCKSLGIMDPWGATREAEGSEWARRRYEHAAMAAIIAANLRPAPEDQP